MIIYKVTNLENHKSYVGITSKTLDERKRKHFNTANRKIGNSCFHKAIRRYGRDNFVWEILENVLFAETMFLLEKHYIEKLNTLVPNGYNLTIGGEGTLGSHHKLSPETRKKMSLSRIGIIYSEETRRKIGLKRLGQKHSEESKKKMSNTRKGTHCGSKNPMYGKHASAETRKKISAALLGKKFTDEHKKNISKSWEKRRINQIEETIQ